MCVLSGDKQNRTERMSTGEVGVCVCVYAGVPGVGNNFLFSDSEKIQAFCR